MLLLSAVIDHITQLMSAVIDHDTQTRGDVIDHATQLLKLGNMIYQGTQKAGYCDPSWHSESW